MYVNEIIKNKLVNIDYHLLSFLGKGAYGFVYNIGNNKVIKITTDESEALNSSLLTNKKLSYVVNIFRVFKFKSINNFWFIEEEKLSKPSKMVIEGLKENELENKLLLMFFDYEEGLAYVKDYVESGNVKEEEENDGFSLIPLATNMIAAYQELKKININYRDFHVNNVMFDKKTKNYKIIDLGSTNKNKGNVEEV